MSKVKLIEMTINNSASEVMEDINFVQEPDYQITDVTVIPDEEYRPTIQGILIALEESQQLHESQSSSLSINILSETVNEKTGYSHSLFEFESNKGTITLSLAMTESEKYNGVYNVSAYTTKGEKVFETNTQCPKKAVQKYLNSLSSEYLIDEPKKLNESYDMYNVVEDAVSEINNLIGILKGQKAPDIDCALVISALERIVSNIEKNSSEAW